MEAKAGGSLADQAALDNASWLHKARQQAERLMRKMETEERAREEKLERRIAQAERIASPSPHAPRPRPARAPASAAVPPPPAAPSHAAQGADAASQGAGPEAWPQDPLSAKESPPPHCLEKKSPMTRPSQRWGYDTWAELHARLRRRPMACPVDADDDYDGGGGGGGGGAAGWDEAPKLTMLEVLGSMTAAEARRRYAPSWTFIAYEADREFLERALSTFWAERRWLPPSQLPPRVRVACAVARVDPRQLYVQEPFAPLYVAVLRRIDDRWYRWAVDHFFTRGTWPLLSDLPESLLRACQDIHVRPDEYG